MSEALTARAARRRVLAVGFVGAAVAVLAAGRVWVRGTVPRAPLPALVVTGTGRQVAPAASACALVAAAGLLSLLALRGRARAVAAAVVAVAGVGVAAASARLLATAHAALAERAALVAGGTGEAASLSVTWWAVVSLLAGLLVAGGAAVAVARGRTWDALADRYDADTPRTRPASPDRTAADWWRAVESGTDPTEGGADRAGGTPVPASGPAGAAGNTLGSEPAGSGPSPPPAGRPPD